MLKYIQVPHVSTYERRWARRLMIVVATPQELIRAVFNVFKGAAYWWRQP